MQLQLFDGLPVWRDVKDGYRLAARMYQRHYSSYQYKDGRRSNPNYRNRNLICGPGEKLVLMTPNNDALFVWRKFISDDGQQGINCAVFRNESQLLSSYLILQAEQIAAMKWPGERMYTYVDDKKLRRFNKRHIKNRPPGYCFLMAGWKMVMNADGTAYRTKVKRRLVFEKQGSLLEE